MGFMVWMVLVMAVEESVEFEVHGDPDGGGDIDASGRGGTEFPVANGADRRLVEIFVTRGMRQGNGRWIPGSADRDPEQDDPLTVFESCLLRIDRRGIAKIVRLRLTGSFLPSARCLGLLGERASGRRLMMRSRR
jgi:hypothetical protein